MIVMVLLPLCTSDDCVSGMLAMLVITVFFPQRVDENLDAASEEPSPATEDFDMSQFASEGKPTFKTQPKCPTFYILSIMYYHSCIITIGLGLL